MDTAAHVRITASITGRRIAAAAAEAERAELSRRLHDDALQVIAGVIQRLERRPDTEFERDALRGVADRLRHIASDLHPPILDDLGLALALEALTRDGEEPDVVVEIASAGCAPAERLPVDVEVGAYRVVQEAIANAVAHSGTTRVEVRGRVDPDELLLEVVDHGKGFEGVDVTRAMRHGHLGVVSMRRQAEAIEARLDVRSALREGTTVTLRWPA